MEVQMQIIDFEQARKAYDRYDDAVRTARSLAEDVLAQLITAAVNIATSGPWREWDAAIPEGTVMAFEPDSLADCGDPTVVRLIMAADALEEILQEGEDNSPALPPGPFAPT
jgi:hypothetical protein